MKTEGQHGTSCIVFTRRFLSPIHIRSNRKVASHPKTSKLYSSKRLHSIVVLTSVKCAGSRHCQIKFGTCMAQKKFAQADSKTGSKIRSKTGDLTKGRLSRPDSGHGAYAGAHRRVVFQRVLLPRIAWCSKLRTLFWGRSLAPSCVPFERSVIVSASSACGQAEGKKVLVQVLSGTAPRGTIRGRLFNRGLVRKWARFLLLVWLIFLKTWREKLWIFRACFWVRFSCPFLGQAYWRVQPEYPFLGPKYGLQVGAKT